MAKPVYIHAAAALGPHGDITRTERRTLHGDPVPLELKELVKTVVGVSLRQASHLVELAAIGSQLCLKRLSYPAPENTAVYVGTGLAEVRKNEAVFWQVMPPGSGLASPFDFINAANNMAAFYVAKLGNFRARNLTVTQEEFSFEWALQLAAADLHAGEYRQVLIGGVDENSQPRAGHLRRIALRDDQPMGEGSGWLYLSVAAAQACGELIEVKRVAHATGLVQALHAWRRPEEPLTLLPGLRIEPAEVEHLVRALPDLQVQDYLAFCGGFHTAAAFGVAALFDPPVAPGLFVHLNRDTSGRAMLCAVRVF
jgi:Beta-ketoacyl synthase, N-terminal domain